MSGEMQKKVRVLHVFGRLDCGGAETLAMELFRNIDRDKFQFDFLVHTDEKCFYDDEVSKLGGTVYHAPPYRVYNHFAYVKWWKNFLNTHNFNVIHGHMYSIASIYLKVAKSFGLKTIAHSHSTSNGAGFAARIKDFLQLTISIYTDYKLACSPEAGKWLFRSDNFSVVNNGIDAGKFKFDPGVRSAQREKLAVTDKFVIGHVGRFSEPKNHTFLLDIFRHVRQKRNNAILLLVGDGELRQSIEQKVHSLGLENSVIFTGVRRDANELLMAMDVFLFPSLYEGLSVALVEAQASGLKCIVSKNVSRESDLTKNMNFLSLDSSLEHWADTILKSEPLTIREQAIEVIRKSGYGIEGSVKLVEGIYYDRR